MPDIIEIDLDLKHPYLRVNYQSIFKEMEQGAVVVVHQREHAVMIAKTMKRRGYQYGLTAQPDKTWRMFIKKEKKVGKDTNIINADEKYNQMFKELMEGKVLMDKNHGELLAINRNFRRQFPESKKKIVSSSKDRIFSIWLE